MADISKIKVERIIDGVQTGDLCYSLRVEKEGWLLCDGTSYSVSDYPNLFNIIGYIFGGSGDNFNVPNCSGKFLQMDTSKSIGQSIEAGLPNITGAFGNFAMQDSKSIAADNVFKGAFSAIQNGVGGYGTLKNDASFDGATFNASQSSSIYGKSNTVQPPAIIVNYFIKY